MSEVGGGGGARGIRPTERDDLAADAAIAIGAKRSRSRRKKAASWSLAICPAENERKSLGQVPRPLLSHPPRVSIFVGGKSKVVWPFFPSPLQQIKVPIRTQSGGSPEIWQKKEGPRRETGKEGGGGGES